MMLVGLMMLFLATSCISMSTPTMLKCVSSIPGSQLGPMRFGRSGLGDGGGVFANRAIKDGELLCAVPMSAIISISIAVDRETWRGSSEPDMGEAFQTLLEEDGERAALAGYLAKMSLADESLNPSWFSAYSATLPKWSVSDPHMLWWSDDEVALLRGCTAHLECLSVRQEVSEVTATLSSSVLAAEVSAQGQRAVDEAVRAAYVSVLSRSFTLGAERGEVEMDESTSPPLQTIQALVPVLDFFQHGAAPSVGYAYEQGADGEGTLIVARAIGDIPVGTELSISYGCHPDFVFGVHYGFVPPLLEQRGSCYAVLRFDEEDAAAVAAAGEDAQRGWMLEEVGEELGEVWEDEVWADEVWEGEVEEEEEEEEEEEDVEEEGLGAEAVRQAQRSLWATTTDDHVGDFAADWFSWSESDVRARPALALSALFEAAGWAVDYPLRFGLSAEDLDLVSSGTRPATRAAGDVNLGGGAGLLSVLASARLCVLRDDGSGATRDEQAEAAMRTVLLSGSIDELNDIDSAILVTRVASRQREAMRQAEREQQRAREDADASVAAGRGDGDAPAPMTRDMCVQLAAMLRASEAVVLERLCAGGEAGALFEVDGWDELTGL